MTTSKHHLRTSDGHQIVVFDDKFAYAWAGEPDLDLGEQVILPGRSKGSHWTGTVTGFGSEFEGVLKLAIDRLNPLPRKWPTDAQRAQWAKEYEAGMTVREIAEKHGRSYGGIHNGLRRQKVQLRKRGGFH